ncbi:MAG TPA: hypothetical protein VF654_08775, partial [Pyrinomonadaceae bacterium]
MPPQGRAEGPGGSSESAARGAAPLNPRLRGPLLHLLVFFAAFAGLYVTHRTLLGLPYFWDEAGYFVPAARDIYADGAFIPHSTLSNAHPPLVMAWLALAWKLFGFHIEVARTAMLAVSAFALAGVFALGSRVANRRVGLATVVCAAAYPVFFAQSSLAHLDMMVAALTMWALVFYLPPGGEEGGGEVPVESPPARRAVCVALLALAALAKETAVLVPFVLFGWELLTCHFFRGKSRALACV